MKQITTLVLFSFIIFSSDLFSQWQSCNGPWGGSLNAFASDGSRVYAGTYSGGIFISYDNGSTWVQSNNGLTNTTINCLLVWGGNIYAGTWGGGVFRSNDNGLNWIPINQGINFLSIFTLTASGSNIIAGTYGAGVFISGNNGDTWTTSNNGLTSLYVKNSISGLGYVFLATEGGVFRSADNGASWASYSNGLSPLSTFSVGIAGDYIYAGTYENGAFRSTDFGANWYQVNNGLTAGTTIYTLIGVNWNILAGTYARGIFVSSNNGNQWNQENSGLPNSTSLNTFTVKDSWIFAGTNGTGAYKRDLSQLIGIKIISTNVPETYKLFQNYPNPFNPNTKIRFSIPENSKRQTAATSSGVKLIVYDILCREVATLVNDELEPGMYEVEFPAPSEDGGVLTSGIYFYRLSVGDFTETKKMILSK